MKGMLRVAALVVVMVGASQAGAQQELVPAYVTTYYSSATHKKVVGHLNPECKTSPTVHVEYTLEGTATQYSTEELVGECGPNGWAIIY